MNKHKTVFLKEAVAAIPKQSYSLYVDATLGGGGHSLELLKSLQEKNCQGCTLICFDLDPQAWQFFKIALLKSEFKLRQKLSTAPSIIEVLTITQGEYEVTAAFTNKNFAELAEVLAEWQTEQKLLGVIADLGLSQNQIEREAGLSYRQDSPLDMRYDMSLAVRAADLLNMLPKKQLVKLFSDYGDISYSLKLAEAIEDYRALRPLTTTTELNNLLKTVVNVHARHRKFQQEQARVYQALRIAVNLEYTNLETFLQTAYKALTPGGVLSVVTFHSGEQRLLTGFSKSQHLSLVSTKPSNKEINLNPRSASALLNIIRK